MEFNYIYKYVKNIKLHFAQVHLRWNLVWNFICIMYKRSKDARVHTHTGKMKKAYILRLRVRYVTRTLMRVHAHVYEARLHSRVDVTLNATEQCSLARNGK